MSNQHFIVSHEIASFLFIKNHKLRERFLIISQGYFLSVLPKTGLWSNEHPHPHIYVEK